MPKAYRLKQSQPMNGPLAATEHQNKLMGGA